MSTSTETQQEKPQGLSVLTLAIASLSSVAAALFIHEFWTGGAILGAGITPVIVAVVSESLKKPTQRMAARRAPREPRPSAMRGDPDLMPVEPAPTREDRFGIWEDEPRPDEGRFHRLKGRPLKIAIATGIAAFVLAAFLLTATELVFGGGGDGGGDRLTIVPGKQQRSTDRDTTTTTQPADEQAAPEEESAPPEATPQTVPTAPQTTTPPEQVPPAETAPAPAPAPSTVPAEPAPDQ